MYMEGNSVKLLYELNDEKGLLRDISGTNVYGIANYEFKISSKEDLDYFIDFFRQVYNEKM